MSRARPGEAVAYLSVVYGHIGDECLPWPFARTLEGYGKVWVDGEQHLVHRLACTHRNGPQPVGKPIAAHKCGNGHLGCCNPAHTKWATPKENSADIAAHGRRIQGEQQHMSKLTEAAVREIRASTANDHELAARFGVNRATISYARRGKTWKHVA